MEKEKKRVLVSERELKFCLVPDCVFALIALHRYVHICKAIFVIENKVYLKLTVT